MERNDNVRNDEPLYNIGEEESPLYELSDGNQEPADGLTVYDSVPSEDDMPENISRTVRMADDKSIRKMPSPFAIMLKTMFTPVEGWKALKRAKFQPDRVAASLFYPCVAFASLSEFSAFVYEANVTVASVLVRAVETFISFFFSYYSVLAAAGILLGKRGGGILNSPFGKIFTMTSMATLPVFYMFYRLLPILGPMLVFLPLWTIYLVFRGVRFLRLPKEKESVATGILCTLEIAMPMLWNWIFTDLIPLG